MKNSLRSFDIRGKYITFMPIMEIKKRQL